MSVDPDRYHHLAQLRDELLTNPIDHPDLTPEDRELIQAYERSTIVAGWKQMTGEDLGFADTLSVHLRGNINGIDSYTSGTLQRAVHQAAAGIAKWQRKPARVLSDITSVDRAMAPLPQPTVVGNMIVFRVPAEPSMLPGFQVSTAAAPALRELVDTLPREATDHDSLQGIFGAHPLIRQAVQAISKAAAVVPDGIALELSVPGEGNNVRRSVLTKATATEIDDYLATPEMSARTETARLRPIEKTSSIDSRLA